MKRIHLSAPNMSGREKKYIDEAFAENWIAPLGPNVNNFEKELAQYTGTTEAAVLVSGTSAIHLALIMLGITSGDEVLASSFTFSATVNPVAYQGATPILIDSEADTWNMCPLELRRAIESRLAAGKKPKAIIMVHLYGMPAKMDELMAVANEYQIPVIEDAAEALGSRYRGKMLGSFGTFGILSFNGNKIITSSGGGALLTHDAEFAAKARFLATQARDNAPHYQHTEIGYNYRMSNVVAGIGRGQLEVIEQRVAEKRAVFDFYHTYFTHKAGVTLLSEAEGFYSNRWLTTILIDPDKAGFDRETLRLAFEAENIESRPLWKPMHLQPVFAHCPAYTNGVSEALFANGLCLPSGSDMTDDDKRRITKVLDKFSV